MPAVGDRLDGKYRILSRLGVGGFGEVFLADDETIPGRYLAIKVLAHADDGDHSNLLFEEHHFATGPRAARQNTLVVHTPDGARHDLHRPIVALGSLPANDVVLKGPSVSRRHCAIVSFRGDVWLYDLESTVGTTVDGQPLVGRMLLDGVHDVTVGRVQIRVAASSDLLL